MTEPAPERAAPTARVRPRRVSLTWLIPAGALVFVAALLLAHLARERGPRIEITFTDAAGLEPGSEIVHRGMALGVVRAVRPTRDLDAAVIEAELAPGAAALAVDGTEFWVVRPEVSLQGVTGLETLIGPRYIAVRPGPPDAPPRRDFTALPAPPATAPPAPGALALTLRAPRLGSIVPGSPVLYRDIRVGTIRAVSLAPDAASVLIGAEIEPRYATLVRANSRFWRVGGLGVDFGLFSGLTVRADSLDQLISAGVAFATPNRPADEAPTEPIDLADAPDNDWLGWAPSLNLDAALRLNPDP